MKKSLRTNVIAIAASMAATFAVAAPNDVIINEFYYNDDGLTVYPGLSSAVTGDWVELLVVNGPQNMQGWQLVDHNSPAVATEGTLTFPSIAGLSAVPTGTLIVIIPDTGNVGLVEDLDPSDGKMVLKNSADGGSLTNVGFTIANGDDNIVLLNGSFANYPPSGTATTAAIDFTAEGTATAATNWGLTFTNPFTGLGAGDGCAFSNDGGGTWNNDNGLVGWLIDFHAPTGTPGVANAGQNLPGASNALPLLSAGSVSPLQPTPSTAVGFSVNATDDGTIAQVRVMTSSTEAGPFAGTAMTLSSGSTYTVSLGTLPHGTVRYFYFEAQDTLGAIGSLGDSVDPSRVYVSANRPAAGEVILNEISSKAGFAGAPDIDWVELYNTSAAVKDISFMGLSDDQPTSGGRPFEAPLGSTISPNGYVVLTADVAAFEAYAPWLASAGSSPRIGDISYGFSSAGDTVSLTDDIGVSYDQFLYDLNPPWANELATDSSAEVINPLSDNSLSSNWSSTAVGNTSGSPGRINFANPISSVSDWMLHSE